MRVKLALKANIPAAIIITLGILLRLDAYIKTPPVWLDEASLVLNIINAPLTGFFAKLADEQYAPLGFLFTERFMITLFGTSEYALRALPLAASCTALIVFYKVAGNFLKKETAIIALLIFALTYPFIHYASEAKQYGFDVLTSVVAYYIFMAATQKSLNLKRTVFLALGGSVLLLFSYSLVFILAGIGTATLIIYYKNSQTENLKLLFVSCAVWLLTFVVLYVTNIRFAGQSRELSAFWDTTFVPFTLNSVSLANFFAQSLETLKVTLYASSIFITLIVILAGVTSLFIRTKKKLMLLTLPIIFMIIASLIHKYPISDRFLLFALPIFIIFLAEGISRLVGLLSKRVPETVFLFLPYAAVIFLFPGLILFDLSSINNPPIQDDVRSALKYYSQHKQTGDFIYVYYGANPQFRYYKRELNLNNILYVIGTPSRDNPQKYIEQLKPLIGKKRVWLIFSHVYIQSENTPEELLFTNYLDNRGKKIDYNFKNNSTIYLYDLSVNPEPQSR